MARGLQPLRHRGFRRLVGGQVASNLGDACYAVALPWYVLAHHGGPVLLATVLAAYGVPRTALVAVGGAAADRWRPWTVMLLADAFRAATVGALAVAAWSGPPRAAVLVPIAVVLGAGEGLFLPASLAVIPRLLPEADLQAGNALGSAGTQLATLVGPAVGGVVVALAGPAVAFVADGASFVVSAVSLAGVRRAQRAVAAVAPDASRDAVVPDAPAADPARPAAAEVATLRRLLRREPVLWVILVTTLVANLGSGGMAEVALPALAHGPLRAGAGGYGALVAAFGGGALLGTLATAQVRRPSRPGVLASVVFLAEAGVQAVVPFAGGLSAVAVAIALAGFVNGFGNVLVLTAVQAWAPAALLGRLMGVVMLASFGVFPVSVLFGGAVTHALGPAAFFPIAAVPLGVAMLGALALRRWREWEPGTASVAEPLPAAG